ncbi:MFS transporter [Nocardia sp. CA-107356]|uniref:MFS transporter n=1 Tax=Nocardia sp. CA-107356 TaxID=3239972 RepID=UPI003D936E11
MVATVVLYYELYVQGAVATEIISYYRMTFTQFVVIFIAALSAGALASIAAGVADRWGRANIMVIGLFLSSVMVLFVLPHTTNKTEYLVAFAVLAAVEGVTLVVTPALVRDFSPQLGRASAMGFWILGPVLGSLTVTEVSSNTLASHPDWRFQYYICGIVGIIVAAIAFIGMRELSPGLRNQLMVSTKDRALVEARAAGIDRDEALTGNWRQILKLDILAPALGFSLFMVLYLVLVGYIVVYFATVFGYSAARANALGNWYWLTNAIALVIAGFASDKLRVRKPFMLLGTIIALVGTGFFAAMATESNTSYYTFALVLAVIAFGSAMIFATWLAAYTETVEAHSPAATAKGMAVFSALLRVIYVGALIAFIFAMPATSTLVDQGPRTAEIVAAYPEQITTVTAVSPATLAALQQNPADQTAGAEAVQQLIKARLAADPQAALDRLKQLGTQPIPAADQEYLASHVPGLQQAQKDSPHQWQRWWWICFACEAIFLPTLMVMRGRWNPARARVDAEEHEAKIQHDLAKLQPS